LREAARLDVARPRFIVPIPGKQIPDTFSMQTTIAVWSRHVVTSRMTVSNVRNLLVFKTGPFHRPFDATKIANLKNSNKNAYYK